jgi:hypothetical protein
MDIEEALVLLMSAKEEVRVRLLQLSTLVVLFLTIVPI